MSAAAGSPSIPTSVRVDSESFLATLFNHPIGFWFIFWGELAERCSFYGMRAVLAVYMAEKLQLGEARGGSYYFTFVAACYFLPLLGGWVADNFLGKYLTIVLFSVPYILGHVILGFENFYALAIALTLLAMGSGVIKPNISPLMGMTYDQYRPGQEQLRSNAFGIFYMAINIGAAISQIAVPYIRTTFDSYFLAFLFPAVLMALAFVVFAAGKPFYAHEVVQRTRRTPEERALQWNVVGQVGLLFVLVMFFWAIFDQSSGTWIYFAKRYMVRDLFVFDYQLDAEMMQAINPFLIVIILPLTTILWTTFNARGIKVRATDKMILGFLLTALCMGVMAYCGYSVRQVAEGQELPDAERITIRWQILAYVFITLAEILISVTGLELAFVAAPKSMKGFVTSLWLASVGMGNLFINVPFSLLYPKMAPGNYFAMLAGILVVVTIVFFLVARRFNRIANELEEANKQAALAAAGGGNIEPDGTAVMSPSTGVMDRSRREGIVEAER